MTRRYTVKTHTAVADSCFLQYFESCLYQHLYVVQDENWRCYLEKKFYISRKNSEKILCLKKVYILPLNLEKHMFKERQLY